MRRREIPLICGHGLRNDEWHIEAAEIAGSDISNDWSSEDLARSSSE
jgi:hypothetical protein